MCMLTMLSMFTVHLTVLYVSMWVLVAVGHQQQVLAAPLTRPTTTATCQGVPAEQRATIVYGVMASAAKFEARSMQHIRQWWTDSTRGAVYLDTVTPRAQQVAPPGVPLISHHQLLATHLHHNSNTSSTSSTSSIDGPFSVRGVLLVLDLAQRYPAADWYAEVDDDTFLVPANLEVALTTYNSSEPWYIGGTHSYADRPGLWGRHAWGGAGIFLSRGALQLLAPTLAACAAAAGRVYDHGDAALGACVLAAGIPVTYHPGLHFDFRHPTLLEHHPPAPFLGTHQHHAFLSDGHRWALRVNPAGFAQQARVVVEQPPDAATTSTGSSSTGSSSSNGTRTTAVAIPTIITISDDSSSSSRWPPGSSTITTNNSDTVATTTTGSSSSSSSVPAGGKRAGALASLVLSISSGVAVEVWQEGAPGTALDFLPLPARWGSTPTNPPSTTRPPPLAHFKVVTTLQQPPSKGCGIATMYDLVVDGQHMEVNRSMVKAAVGFDRVVVYEPWWPDRWRHAPRALCLVQQRLVVSGATGRTVLHVHLGKGEPHGAGHGGQEHIRVDNGASTDGVLLLPAKQQQQQQQAATDPDG